MEQSETAVYYCDANPPLQVDLDAVPPVPTSLVWTFQRHPDLYHRGIRRCNTLTS